MELQLLTLAGHDTDTGQPPRAGDATSACSAPPLPTAPCPVCPRLAQEFEPFRQAAYWKAMHQRGLQREQRLQQRIDELEAKLRLREQHLFGKKTEAHAAAPTDNPQHADQTAGDPPRPRGQQRGQPGPTRRDYSHLPAVVEEHELLADDGHCQRRGSLWHADETRWQVFTTIEGKVGYRWYLWVFHSQEVVVFVLAAGRSRDVPQTRLGEQAEGILVVDRYKAYQAIRQIKDGLIVLAFCWAHVRRDFVRLARSWPDQESWALGWVERIGQLYRLNAERLTVREDRYAFAVADDALRVAVTAFGAGAEAELLATDVHPARQKVRCWRAWGITGRV